ALLRRPYKEVALVGFSMGGNLTLVYLGERGQRVHPTISKAVAFSVPCDLGASARQLARPANYIYMRRFMRNLRHKMVQKQALFPDLIDLSGIERMRTFQQFDDRFTAPLHGFSDAENYW